MEELGHGRPCQQCIAYTEAQMKEVGCSWIFSAELGSAALSLPKSISPRTNLRQEQAPMPQCSKVGPGKLSAGHHDNRQLSALCFPSLQHSLPLDLKTALQKQANIPVSTVKWHGYPNFPRFTPRTHAERANPVFWPKETSPLSLGWVRLLLLNCACWSMDGNYGVLEQGVTYRSSSLKDKAWRGLLTFQMCT